MKQDLIQAYKDYSNALRLGDFSLARLAAREYNELLEQLGGPEVVTSEMYLSMGMEKRPGEQMSIIWDKVCDLLSYQQHCKTMGIPKYKDKANLVKSKISKSKRVHKLCDDLIALCEKFEQLVKENQ